MARTAQLRRHSIKDGVVGGTIGLNGFALSRAVGRKQLRGCKFTHCFASDLWRTHQTLAGFSEGAGDLPIYFTPRQPDIYLIEWPELIGLWQKCHKAAKRGEDMLQAAFAEDRDLVERAAIAGAQKFRAWVETLPEDANVLVVGHSPYMEILIYGLTGIVIPALKECQGVRVRFDDTLGTVTVDWQSPDLDPADIRHNLFPKTHS